MRRIARRPLPFRPGKGMVSAKFWCRAGSKAPRAVVDRSCAWLPLRIGGVKLNDAAIQSREGSSEEKTSGDGALMVVSMHAAGRRRRLEEWRLPVSCTFGSPAVIGIMPLDQKLCVPVFQRVCQCRVWCYRTKDSAIISEGELKIAFAGYLRSIKELCEALFTQYPQCGPAHYIRPGNPGTRCRTLHVPEHRPATAFAEIWQAIFRSRENGGHCRCRPVQARPASVRVARSTGPDSFGRRQTDSRTRQKPGSRRKC
ncbi:MAG: hypothetical protein JWQ23_1582 [Herminiimonas sp.]|nr:hypothetical protein [Herminiimonas sp.]